MIFAVEWTTEAAEKEPEKNFSLNGNQPLTFVPTGLNFLSINLNKPTGEQAIVSS